MWLSRRKLLVLLVGVVVAGVGGAYLLDDANAYSGPRPDTHCRQQVELEAVRRPGLPWQQHLNRLVVSGIDFGPSTRYFIVDEQANRTYYWPYIGTFDGYARFAVQTRWTVLHPDWPWRRWTLHYDCDDT